MSPTLELAAAALVTISITAPVHPNTTPRAFLPVMGSLSIIAARIIAKIGIDVVTMLALMGDVMLRPIV